jgi:hypothetical protein
VSLEERRGGGPIRDGERPVDVLEVLRHGGGGEPELECDLLVLLPERSVAVRQTTRKS